ncbi:MAG: MarR family winged helix-turn-helix transcriptional regulator [Chloroflexota bacterium]|nr:MarR family winged helix-turn-helix transcriptional regulator [Chloroflexota bacterium]
MLDDAGQALFRLGRIFSKQPLHQLLAQPTGCAVELSRILAVQAVGAGPEEPDREVTVGVVADRLGVDPSTASRLVAETIRDGYLARAASPVDARRVPLELTPAGRALAEDARRYQRAVFEHVTRDWSERERDEFARLFVKFADAVAEARTGLATPDAHAQR